MDDATPMKTAMSPSQFEGLESHGSYDTSTDCGRDLSTLMRNAAVENIARPLEVEGPMGLMLTMASLPPPDTRRWVVRRKAEVLAAINGGLLTAAEACARYRLSPEELTLWQASVDRAGVPGLRVTRIQLYRDYPAPRSPVRASAAPAYGSPARESLWSR